ncbi:MAG: class I SAM-dependent methyltransferase [Bacillota bacterium]
MRLPPRLRVLAGMVPPGATLADVGTDHALLPIALVSRGVCPRAVATEAAIGPYRRARLAVESSGLGDRIDVRLGDGLAPVAPGEAQAIVVAGLGGLEIVRILEGAGPVLASAECLIVQPNRDQPAVRRWLTANGWRLETESCVAGEPPHVIIAARPGQPQALDEVECLFGPCLLADGAPAYRAWLERRRRRLARLRAGLEAQGTPRSLARAAALAAFIGNLEEAMRRCSR